MRRLRGVGAMVLAIASATAAAPAPPDVTVRRSERTVRFATRHVVARIDLRPYRLTIRLRRGPLLTREESGGLSYERDGIVHRLGDVAAVEDVQGGVQLAVETDEGKPAAVTVRFLAPRTLEVAFDPPAPIGVAAAGDRFRSPRGERIYGLTERLRDSPPLAPGIVDIPVDDIRPPEVGSLDRRGETIEMRVLPTLSIYAPFYQSSRGYGLAVAGTTFGRFDLAHSDPDVVAFRFEMGTTPESRRLVFRIFAGPSYLGILSAYTALVGPPLVPPSWAFRHWRWRGELASGATALLDGKEVNAQVAEDVHMYEALGIPPGVYLFDRPVLQGEFGFARWAWDEVRLPNTQDMLASLRRRGYGLAIWSSLWMCGSEARDNGSVAQQLGFLVPGPGGPPHCADLGGTSFIMDPTNPHAHAFWLEKAAEFLVANGIRAIKLDRGEEHIPSAATDVYADGRTGREVRNDYPTLQARIHHDVLERAWRDGDHVLLTRAGYTGTPRYAVFWGGDIPGSESFGAGPGTDLGLRAAIIAQQRAAFLGVPIWGSDTGGYYEFKDREVFARWIEFSAFSGIMEIGGVGAHAPWDMPTEPRVDEKLIAIYRRYTLLRHALGGYIAKAASAADVGTPLVRPMPFYDRRDPELADRWDQYLFGPDLLVAPVWRVGQRRRRVYLPRGRWRNFWDRSQLWAGPVTITLEVPLDTILVFVRDGAERVPAAVP